MVNRIVRLSFICLLVSPLFVGPALAWGEFASVPGGLITGHPGCTLETSTADHVFCAAREISGGLSITDCF
jgi:hypothetical protein